MQKLYYEDGYIKEFTAEVLEIKEKDGYYHVVLDKTAFFPGGGGQFCDLGKIDSSQVSEVYEENGVVYHVTKQKFIKTHSVKCSIDWKRRQDGMHQHLGQAVLSGCFFKLFNANTLSFHLGNDVSTVDIKGHLDEEKIMAVEKYANKIIGENINVQSFVAEETELKELNLRRDLPKTNEEIRIVKIGDLDISACCGVHPKSTQELRMIKINRWEKHKEATRVEFVSGSRAIEGALKKDKFLSDICRYLSCNDEEAIKSIKNLKEQVKATLDENKRISDQVASFELKAMIENPNKIGSYTVIKKIYDCEDVKYVSKVATKLALKENTIALMAVKDEEKVNLIFSASKNIKGINMNDLLKDTLSHIDGRGGGSQFLAQGAGMNVNLNSAMDFAIIKLKMLIK
ncbi:DHHA1 domain-containing protein [Clostridium sp.]|uniref:alanyl-tRNA editing protein n=1 Tax=Clostridium sp. TaxID=1506 RepID=UPI001A3A9AFB|nr:DHHA1 domain-containing protein [Clostridium sp.]MBK5237268.1 alanyl-tRNA editing protein AlaX-L [Clostridium sp.]